MILPTITDPRRGSYTLKETDFSALKALAAGYQRIDYRDGNRLIFLGMADRSEDGYTITAAGLLVSGEGLRQGGLNAGTSQR